MKVKYNIVIIALVALILPTGCSSLHKRNPMPEESHLFARVPGIPDARMWGDEPPHFIDEWLRLSKTEKQERYPKLFQAPHTYLALSGGGSDGAFGAGVLAGWTDRGDRPEFSIVTGVSTGALIAPFAFLGSAYDSQLKEVYTTSATEDIISKLSLVDKRSKAAIVSSEPLKKLIAKYVDQKMLEAIGIEHRSGRRLFVGTTNLDASRPVIWNIGAIAASDAPGSLALIHDVLVASASIPGAFPPVYIEVEVNGILYDEMHVDGGAASQVFIIPTGLHWGEVEKKFEVQGTTRAYIIRNDRFVQDWKAVQPRLTDIAGRSISTLISNNGFGDLYRLYLETQQAGIEYHLTYIPDTLNETSEEPFDKVYMNKLFELGYGMALSGDLWHNNPPGF